MTKLSSLTLVSALLMACGAPEPPKAPAPAVQSGEPAPPAKADAPPATPAKAAPTLAETPDAKLGTNATGLGLAVGERAPDATLDDLTGKKQTLSELYKQGPTFVVFYRGGWCPFCNLQLHDLAASQAEFAKRGIRIIAISVDKPTEEAKTQAKDGIPFPMFSDSKLVAHKAFKVVHATSPEEQQKMAGFGLDLTAYSGETHKSFAVPSIFLVDKTGVIRFSHADEDYKTRPSAKQLLGVADRLAAK